MLKWAPTSGKEFLSHLPLASTSLWSPVHTGWPVRRMCAALDLFPTPLSLNHCSRYAWKFPTLSHTEVCSSRAARVPVMRKSLSSLSSPFMRFTADRRSSTFLPVLSLWSPNSLWSPSLTLPRI